MIQDNDRELSGEVVDGAGTIDTCTADHDSGDITSFCADGVGACD